MDEQPKVKVRFTADALYETEGRGRGKQFKAGKVYELPPDQAERWLRRNAAELADPAKDQFPEVDDPNPERAGAGASGTEQARGVAAGQETGEPSEGKTPLKGPHPVPHPSQAEPTTEPARGEHRRASSPGNEPTAGTPASVGTPDAPDVDDTDDADASRKGASTPRKSK